MVGGGIFAVLGLSVQIAHGGAPIAFLVAGLVALLTARSYALLSTSYPSRGGTVTFINRGFGPGLFSGGINVLLWLSYIVMLSLYSQAFGSYAASFLPDAQYELGKHLFLTAAVVLIAVLNVAGASTVARAERYVVAIKIAILLLFVVVGAFGVSTARLSPDQWSPPLSLVAGGMIVFLAYEGFELIANTAEDVVNPARTLTRASTSPCCSSSCCTCSWPSSRSGPSQSPSSWMPRTMRSRLPRAQRWGRPGSFSSRSPPCSRPRQRSTQPCMAPRACRTRSPRRVNFRRSWSGRSGTNRSRD